MINIIIWGAGGRMGNRLIRLIQQAPDLTLSGAIEAEGHPGVHQDAGQYHQLPKTDVDISLAPDEDCLMERGVVLDFSLSGGLASAAEWAMENNWALISGTTALSDIDRLTLAAAAEVIPVMHAPNFSIGIQILLKMVEKISRSLPDNFDCTILETHHTKKMDRPSGTGLAFKDKVAQGNDKRGLDITSLRGGNVIGEHSIRFISDLEDICITHNALNRDVFAAGALEAGRWMRSQSPGRYTLADMLELN